MSITNSKPMLQDLGSHLKPQCQERTQLKSTSCGKILLDF